ncbi:MAG: hypothetical protein BJ554DRAFT_5068 [Olpidium bornovanus]|uniref:Uncharacterized protein n=1 Tax=Olpidium bornovanus TaxID=278681 RepID=A0A8H8DDS3_9FUNG|nr:MAG: hypothetical protein BJ554DRAFT_5068 [Olpidium bornovanus]
MVGGGSRVWRWGGKGKGGKLFDWRALRGERGKSSSIGGLRGGLFYWSAPGFGGRPALDPAATSALRPPLALCPAPAVLRLPPAFRGVGRRAVQGPCHSTARHRLPSIYVAGGVFPTRYTARTPRGPRWSLRGVAVFGPSCSRRPR